MSPTLANIFLRPLIAALDGTGKGAFIHGCHVPAVCYADDLCLLSCNVSHLGQLLSLAEQFSENWRLEFTNPDTSETKSHCIMFGGDTLAETPSWVLDNQRLKTFSVTEHLGVVLSSTLEGKHHVSQRMKRARGSFYGLTPADILSKQLSPLDKTFLWRTVVGPSLTFGATAVPLEPEDVNDLDRFQARQLKAALGTATSGPPFCTPRSA